MLTMYHGTNTAALVLNAIIGSGVLSPGFHLTHDIDVARNYGSEVVAIQLENNLDKASVQMINKENNYNPLVGNSVETVLASKASINEFYNNLYDAEVVH